MYDLRQLRNERLILMQCINKNKFLTDEYDDEYEI